MERPYRHPKFTLWLTLAIAAIVVITVAGYHLFFDETDHGLAVVALVGPAADAVDGPEPAVLQAASALALEDWAEQHGPPPVDVRHFAYGNFPGEVFDELRSLQGIGRLTAVVGDTTPETTRVLANLAQELQVPHISVFTEGEPWFEDYPFSFSLPGLAEQLAVDTAAFLTQQGSMAEVAVVTRGSEFPSLASQLTAALPADTLVYRLDPDPQAPDDWQGLFTELTAAASLGAVVLELPLTTAGPANEMIQALDLTAAVVSIPNALPRAEELTDPQLEGMWVMLPLYGVQALHESTSQYRFREQMLTETGQPEWDEQGYPVYDAVQLLLEVMSRAGTAPRSMREELVIYEGEHLSGRLAFSETGLPADSIYQAWQVRNGELLLESAASED